MNTLSIDQKLMTLFAALTIMLAGSTFFLAQSTSMAALVVISLAAGAFVTSAMVKRHIGGLIDAAATLTDKFTNGEDHDNMSHYDSNQTRP